MLRARELLGKRRPSSPRFLAGVRDMDRRLEAAVKTAVFSQKVDQVEGLVDYARLTGPEWSGRVAGLCAGTGHLFFIRAGLPAQNFASVAKGKHRKILTSERRRIRPATVYPPRSPIGYSLRVKSRRVLLSNSIVVKSMCTYD